MAKERVYLGFDEYRCYNSFSMICDIVGRINNSSALKLIKDLGFGLTVENIIHYVEHPEEIEAEFLKRAGSERMLELLTDGKKFMKLPIFLPETASLLKLSVENGMLKAEITDEFKHHYDVYLEGKQAEKHKELEQVLKALNKFFNGKANRTTATKYLMRFDGKGNIIPPSLAWFSGIDANAYNDIL